MSKRTEILKYLKDRILRADLFDGEVFTSQQRAYALEDLPCALIRIQSEKQEVFTESVPRTIRKMADISIELIAEHDDGAEEEMHDVFSDLEKAVIGDDTLGDLVSRLMPESLEFTTYLQAERPIISGKLSISAQYYESMAVSQSLPDLTLNPEIMEDFISGHRNT